MASSVSSLPVAVTQSASAKSTSSRLDVPPFHSAISRQAPSLASVSRKEWANKRGCQDEPVAHFTNCAQRTSTPNTMLIQVGLGSLPAAMCTSNSGARGGRAIARHFRLGRSQFFNARQMPQILLDQRVQILAGELRKKSIQANAQCLGGKTGA